MIIQFIETTIKGDSFGFSVDTKGRKILKGTRTFTITIDSSANRSMDEIYEALPKKGDAHPNMANCYVKDVECVVSEDVHVYIATVDYESKVTEEQGEGNDPTIEWPWDQPTDISFSTNTSFAEVQDKAYAFFGSRTLGTMTDDFIIQSGNGTYPNIPVVNVPFHEYPENLPEEVEPAIQIDIAFAIEEHNIQDIQVYLSSHLTVNDNTVSIKNYEINKYTGYFSEFRAKAAYFKSPRSGILYPYWDVSLSLVVRPKKTWIRPMINMSYNRLVTGVDDVATKEHITVKDSKSNKLEPITAPVRIRPSGVPVDINDDGTLAADDPGSEQTYVNLYLTKPLSNWSPFMFAIP